jgi:hypothetical protein
MNILVDLLPDTVDVDGSKHIINTDFRIGILFEELMQDNTLSSEQKVYLALNLYYKEMPTNIEQAIKEIEWFYRCGKDIQLGTKTKTKATNKEDKIYSFEYDDEYIYSAFLTQYRIDLQDVKTLHWWKFKAMFKSLDEDSRISKIMGYRAMKITDEMSDNDKKHYREMKRIYSLPDLRSENEKELDFHNSLASVF